MQNIDVDVAVVGSGIGGLTAALISHDIGAEVAVLEKAPKVGGTSAYSYGLVWVPNNHLQDEKGYSDSYETVLHEMKTIATLPPNERVLQRLISMMPRAAKYLAEKANVPWRIVNYPEKHYNGRVIEAQPFPLKTLGDWSDKVALSPHTPMGLMYSEMLEMGYLGNFRNWNFDLWKKRRQEQLITGGSGLICFLLKALLDRRIRILLNTRANKLLTNGDSITGIECSNDQPQLNVRCRKGVILAMGGYDWNKDIAMSFESLPDWGSSVPPYIEGDHLKLAGDVGAAIGYVPNMVSGHLGVMVPGEENFGKPLIRILLEGSLPGYIIVNGEGNRFGNEASFFNLINRLRDYDYDLNRFTNWPCYLIFDQRTRDTYPLGFVAPGKPLPEGMAETAHSIRELAKALEINDANLERTIENFNADAQRGLDSQFNRGQRKFDKIFGGDNESLNPFLSPINSSPFYGIKLRVTSPGRLKAGLIVNENAQVLNTRNNPLKNLCAAGNTVAFTDVGGMGSYTAGLPMSRGMTFGFIGGKFLMGGALE